MELTIADLVQRFDSGEIRLPLMQRDYVWRAKKVVRLLDSLYRNWPIGSFYVWQTQDAPPTRSRVGAPTAVRRLDGFYGFLLDGQQRLTSLSLAVQSSAEGHHESRAFFDLENEQFVLGNSTKTVARRIGIGDPLLVPLSEVVTLRSDGATERHAAIGRVIEALREQKKLGRGDSKEFEYRKRLDQVSRMLQKRALCEEFTDDDEEHAFELFSRLNKGGTSLQAGDVEAARLASAGTRKIVEPMRQFVAGREMRAMGINFVFLLRAVVTVHRGNCSFSNLPRSWADDTGEVETSWRKTEQALRLVVSFLRKEVGWTTRRWLPSTMALIPIVYLLSQTNMSTLNEREVELIRKYLLITGLRSMFRGSTETTVNGFVNAVRDTRGDRTRKVRALFDRIPKVRKYKIRREDVRGASGLYSPLMQVYLAYLVAHDAKSWMNGRALADVLKEELSGDPLAVHHIFPKKFMADQDIALDRLNTCANYAILSQPDNASLADQPPFDSWRGMRSNQREYASLQLCFTASDNLLLPGAYEEFVEYRSEKLADQLNKFLGLG
jgi:hypothetical protein